MERTDAQQVERGELAATLRAHLKRKQNGSEGIAVLTRNEADVVAALIVTLSEDEGVTDLGLLAADVAAMLLKQTGF